VGFYWGGGQLESWTWHRLSWLRFSWFSSVSPCIFRDSASITPRPFASKSFPIHYLTTIRHCLI
jgi:hypothetical protein